jgi:hypothetical protein
MATPEQMLESMIKNFVANTGKALDEWIKVAKASKLTKHGEIVKLLKVEHKMGHGYANLVAQEALRGGSAPVGNDDLVEAQYSGGKAGLRPIYDSLIGAIRKFGSDVEVSPKKAYVSLRRSKQFAILQPSTATRLDVGINLKGAKSTERLEASGSFNAMVSHRVRVESAGQVDKELLTWLRQAYDAA